MLNCLCLYPGVLGREEQSLKLKSELETDRFRSFSCCSALHESRNCRNRSSVIRESGDGIKGVRGVLVLVAGSSGPGRPVRGLGFLIRGWESRSDSPTGVWSDSPTGVESDSTDDLDPLDNLERMLDNFKL